VDPEGDGARPDVLVFGGPRGGGRPGRRWLRRLALPLALVAGAGVAVVVHAGRGTDPSGAPASRPSTVASSPPPIGRGTPSPDPVVTEVGRPLLGVTAGWELFGRGPDGVVRVQFARGRVTSTGVPPLASTGPVSFVVGRDWAVVRPLDVVPGYVVRDGQAARPLAGALGWMGPVLPGPDQTHLWAPVGSVEHPAMALVDSAGRPTGVSVPIPATMARFADPDGAGYLLLRGPGGVYDARPGSLRRITTGELLAAGPTRWLSLECDDRYRCATVVIDRDTRARTAGGPVVEPGGGTGVISPDGTMAALPEATGVHLVRLPGGADRRLAVPGNESFEDGSMVWSPDSRWLFVAGGNGRLYPVDAATGEVHALGAPLPPLTQLAIRKT
jgi:hypothetical protein